MEKKFLVRGGVLLAFVLMLSLAGCAKAGLGEGNYQGVKSGTGWPSSKLSSYGLGGMSQPTGASDITWATVDDDYARYGQEYPGIYISFSGTAATDAAIQDYFSSWTAQGASYQGSSSFMYTKGSVTAYYSFSSGSGFIYSGYPTN
jgi:hypothetical protein